MIINQYRTLIRNPEKGIDNESKGCLNPQGKIKFKKVELGIEIPNRNFLKHIIIYQYRTLIRNREKGI